MRRGSLFRFWAFSCSGSCSADVDPGLLASAPNDIGRARAGIEAGRVETVPGDRHVPGRVPSGSHAPLTEQRGSGRRMPGLEIGSVLADGFWHGRRCHGVHGLASTRTVPIPILAGKLSGNHPAPDPGIQAAISQPRCSTLVPSRECTRITASSAVLVGNANEAESEDHSEIALSY